ncbi:adenosine kinase [Prochlorococcus marinus]|uniref:Adenosine kinase n=1 Tax=Prochlorococcus marinus XMU1408 TaxID=2213228 RepID=A0A318R398_PROMR|nr:adenosine kinase [Prochlorococcus marinus]MBW3041532.1 adenosine kinase [Prochlorococcus marinus str. XMU1408]PYE02690.1 adenosine kinase [Prochlorococcus marinus XMU1408]
MKERINESSLDVVGIGNAIVDVLTKIDDSLLEKLSFKKGSMTLIDENKAKELYEIVNNGIQKSGGSVANSLACVSQLGGKAAFIGRVRNDKLGEIFTEEISRTGTIYKTPPSSAGPSTARCLIFITPDAQRTMCTYLGASVLLEPNDLDLSIVREAKILYLEGYLWDNPAAKNAFIKAAEIAKNAGRKVALSLSDSFCVNRHRESFIKLVEDYIDILFANEEEITSLYKTSNLKLAIEKLKPKCEITAITLGKNGSILIVNGKEIIIDPYIHGNAIDTTGAGDIYAGGFLKGLANNLDPAISAKIGSICAGQIVTQLGSRSNTDLLNLINKHL